MKFFIRIKNGQPFEHPILEENFRVAFPKVDIDNLPPEFAEFQKTERPIIGVYEVYENCSYEWNGDIVEEVHHIRPMTQEEKTQKQNETKEYWAQNGGFPSYIFNEETCLFDSPVPYPKDGNVYIWDEDSLTYVLVPRGEENGS